MDASIFLVGGDEFLSTFLDKIRALVTCTVEVVPDVDVVMSLIQAQQPDIVIFEGHPLNSSELCHQVKTQPRLAWIYCIVVDPVDHSMRTTPEIEPLGSNPSRQAELLAQGADAYLCLSTQASTEKPMDPAVLEWQDALLKAQLIAGLRSVRTHRELVRTNDILSAIALSDPLTELNNRRALDWELPRQVQNARTRKEPLSLMMLDVDYFKVINDTYGHPAGDRVLKLIASRLRHNLRFRDTLFRYGGEEFVILLSATDQQEARAVGQRLCSLVSEQPFTIQDDLDLTITISGGTTSLEPEDDPKGMSFLKRADKNLLRAKASGRNRSVSSLDGNLEDSQLQVESCPDRQDETLQEKDITDEQWQFLEILD
jgi:two-component system, cell cycle response regulator